MRATHLLAIQTPNLESWNLISGCIEQIAFISCMKNKIPLAVMQEG